MSKRKVLLVMVTVLVLVFVACGQSGDEAKVTTEEPNAATATTQITPEEEIIPEIETLPMLDQLLDSNSATQNLSENFKADINLIFDMNLGNAKYTIETSGSNLAYGNAAYSDASVKMSGAYSEEAVEKQYRVYGTDGMTTEYTFNSSDNVWYKSEYFDVDDDTGYSLVGEIAEMTADDFSVIDTTSDDQYIYITASPDADFIMGSKTMFSGFGIEDIELSCVCKFVFDKNTRELVSMEFGFEYDNLLTEDMRANGIVSFSIDEFTILFVPNSTPVTVPDDVVANAVAK